MDNLSESHHLINDLAYIFAGLGFFFLGMQLSTKYIKQLFTLRMQERVLKLTEADFLSSIWGFIFGILTSEAMIVTFLTANLSSSQGLNTRKALPIINWNNPGGCLVIFVLFIPLKEIVMYSIGIFGLMLFLERFSRFHPLVGFIFGVSVFLFGIFAISSGSMHILEIPEYKEAIINYIGTNNLVTFFIGAAIGLIAQSFISFVLAMNFAQTGILSLEQSFLFVCGAHLGLAVCTWLLFSTFKGVWKQIMLAEVFFLSFVALLFAFLVYLEFHENIPLLGALVGHITEDRSLQVALFILLINSIAALFLSFFMNFEARLLEYFTPHQLGEDIESPQFLNPYFLKSPALASQLIPKEFAVFSVHLMRYFEFMRQQVSPGHKTLLEKTHQSFQSILAKLHTYLMEFITQADNKFINNKLLNSIEILDNLTRLEENLFQKANYIVILYESGITDEKTQHIIENLVEAEEAIFFTFADTMKELDQESINWLLQIIQEKDGSIKRESIIFSRVSYDYIQSVPALVYLVSLFERDVILINDICLKLAKNK